MRGAAAAWLAFAVGAACALRAPRVSNGRAAPCSSDAQCETDSVCFLGECRGGSSQLSMVLAEVRTPADQQLGALQRGNIDLRASAIVDFQLQPQLALSGTVVQALDQGGNAPVAGASVVLSDLAAPIPDRAASLTAQTDASGAFALSLPASTWSVLVLPPPSVPPDRAFQQLSSTTTGLQLSLPAQGRLAPVNGRILAAGTPLPGARVSAVDPSGQRLSAPGTTDANGAFTLLLPPGPPPFYLQVGPPPDPGPAGSLQPPPIPAFTPRAYDGTSLDLGPLPDPAALTGKVLDARGQPIAAAHVYALSLDSSSWAISRLATTDAGGNFSLSLRAGHYVIEAVPDGDPALPSGLSGEVEVADVRIASPLVLNCPDKSQATGVLVRPDGQRAGAGYQISATRLPDRLVSARVARATPTDATGTFHLVGDGGRYRLEIVPPTATNLPRKMVTVDLLGDGLPTSLPVLQLSPSLSVVGTIANPSRQPVAGATVDFFALDASGTRSVLIATAQSDSLGHYRAVLPDVPSPANQGP